MPEPSHAFTVIDRQKDVLLYQLAKIQMGKTAWMFGYRIHPVTYKPQRHNGIDLPDDEGVPVYAALPGRVTAVWLDEKFGGGNSIVLAHTNEAVGRTGYCHLQKWVDGLKVGDPVTAHQLIGYMGKTGMVTGPHLHFTCRKLIDKTMEWVDPLPLLCVAAGVVEMPDDHVVGDHMIAR
jgi:murein DD-endopeptidase MepM/ murein hydrolase activator NlpD